MIIIKPTIQKSFYNLNSEGLRDYLKELKQTKKEIEKYDWTFEKAGLCNPEFKKDVLGEINKEIKLCEHYFKTQKRKDLFKWIFLEKHKPNDWNEEKDLLTFSNGLVKATIEIYKREKSTEIISYLKNDCELYLHIYKEYRNKDKKTLRSEKSIKQYIQEVKEYLEREIKKVKYNKIQEFYDFVLNPIKKDFVDKKNTEKCYSDHDEDIRVKGDCDYCGGTEKEKRGGKN